MATQPPLNPALQSFPITIPDDLMRPDTITRPIGLLALVVLASLAGCRFASSAPGSSGPTAASHDQSPDPAARTLPCSDNEIVAHRSVGDSGCNRPGVSPLAGFPLGSAEAAWRGHISLLRQDGLLAPAEQGHAFAGSGIQFDYAVEYGGRRIPLLLQINPGPYVEGSLRHIEVSCAKSRWVDGPEDEMMINTCADSEVELLIDLLHRLEGRPTSTREREIKYNPIADMDEEVSVYEWASSWSFYSVRAEVRSRTRHGWRMAEAPDGDDPFRGNTVYIRYRSGGADAEEAVLRVEARQRLLPHDLIRLSLNSPMFTRITPTRENGWSDTRLVVRIREFQRDHTEEPRPIDAIAYEVTVRDQSGRERCSKKLPFFQLPPGPFGAGWPPGHGRGFGQPQPRFDIEFDSASPTWRGCAGLTGIMEGWRVDARITGVIFTDGTVFGY